MKGKQINLNRNNKLPRVLSTLGTVILIVVILCCIPITVPRLFGYQIYNVISPSMTPAIPMGSLIYTSEVVPEEVAEDDVIAFYSGRDLGAIITHRVVQNKVVSGEIITKGDANDIADAEAVTYDQVLGIVVLHVPYIGNVFAVLTTIYGKIAIGCLIAFSVLLHLVADALHERSEKREINESSDRQEIRYIGVPISKRSEK